jgi:phage-related protein
LVEPLGHKMWEIRSKLDNRMARIIFVFHSGQIVLLHGFIKKHKKRRNKSLILLKKDLNYYQNNKKEISMNNKHVGQNFDDFLQEQGIL